MNEPHLPSNDPQLDQKVWNAWVTKSKARDAAQFRRLRKGFGGVVLVGIFLVVLWRGLL